MPIFRQNALISRAPSYGEHLAWRMMPSQIATFRRSAAQCFCGIIALTLVTFVCFRLKADLATTAFIYLAVIVLLSLIGSYFASVVLTIIAVAGLAYFFAPPVFSFAIDLPEDIALVIVFLVDLIDGDWAGQTSPQTDGSSASGRSSRQAGGKGASARHRNDSRAGLECFA